MTLFLDVGTKGRACRVTYLADQVLEVELLDKPEKHDGKAPAKVRRVARELGEYLAGRRKRFGWVPAQGGTEFRRRVYRALSKVPYGKVVSYGELAAMAGRPGAARAVGTAMAQNKFPLLIPCHRVLAAGGKLGGFGGGMGWKKFLLALEKNCVR